MDKFKRGLAQFMQGRYGADAIGQLISIFALIIFIVGIFTRVWILYPIGIVVMGYQYFRMFSRNIQKRYAENQKYLTFKYKMVVKFDRFKKLFKRRPDAKTHKIFKCKACKQKVRVPKGRGKIEITCPKCKNKFIKKT